MISRIPQENLGLTENRMRPYYTTQQELPGNKNGSTEHLTWHWKTTIWTAKCMVQSKLTCLLQVFIELNWLIIHTFYRGVPAVAWNRIMINKKVK